ncbi:MAG: hypothetical protein H0X30_00220 [Anaerolineae bacterium]|nr:hypothetical protein [Anaerolineae bacterium]
MARKRIEFWLDENKPNEQWLLDNIPMLKSKWVFSRCMREGLELLIHFRAWSIKAADVYELLVDLREGNLDKLLAMFPHLRAKFDGGRVGENELAKEIAAQIILQGGSGGYLMKSATMITPKPLPAPPIAEIKHAAVVSADAIADNFLSMFQ